MVSLIQHFEADFLWEVSLKILNSGIILKTHKQPSSVSVLSGLLWLSPLLWPLLLPGLLVLPFCPHLGLHEKLDVIWHPKQKCDNLVKQCEEKATLIHFLVWFGLLFYIPVNSYGHVETVS